MLTDLACRSLISKAKQLNKPTKKADGKGLFLYALPSGAAYWRQKYRIHGKENLISFGAYPEISLSEARMKHTDAYKLILDGVDPAKAKQDAAKQALAESRNTFEIVGRAWFEHSRERWSDGHAHTIQLRLEKDLFQSIGHVPLILLTRKQLLEALQKIEARKSHEVARRSMQFAKSILNYALNEELIQINVANGLESALRPFKRGHFPSMEIDMLPEFLRKFRSNEARLTMETRDAMEMLMLTLVRTSELVKAEWAEFDFEKKLWTVPAARMKMRREHVVPLSRQVLDLLGRRKQLNNLLPNHQVSKYIFPSQLGPHKHMCERTIGLALFAMGYRGLHTGHGFRALGMGLAIEKLGYRHEVPDRQLAHVPENEVRRSYDRAKFLDDRVGMMQKLADYFDSN